MGRLATVMVVVIVGVGGPSASAAPAAPESIVKYYVVRDDELGTAEDLEGVAQRLLHDGGRDAEIKALNLGRPQPDGGALGSDGALRQGWILVLPWDAVGDDVQVGAMPDFEPGQAVVPGPLAPTHSADGEPYAVRRTPEPCTAGARRGSAAIPWAQLRLSYGKAWRHGEGNGVTVAVLGSGVDAAAPALSRRVQAGFDLISGQPFANVDCEGIGTAMAGVITAQPRPGTGLVGVAPAAQILPIKVGGAGSTPSAARVVEALSTARKGNATVVVFGWPVDLSTPVVGRAVAEAIQQDILVIVPAGIDGRPSPAWEGLLRVGAVAPDDGPIEGYPPSTVDVFAPGYRVRTLGANGDGEVEGTGSYLAAAFVAGVAALVRGRNATATAAEASTLIVRTSIQTLRGTKLLDPVRALDELSEPIAISPTSPGRSGERSTRGRLSQVTLTAALVILLFCAHYIWQAVAPGVARRKRDRAGKRGGWVEPAG